MSAHVSDSFEFEVGGVYTKKNGMYKAKIEHGLQASRYERDGSWTLVFGLETDEGLIWVTGEERESLLSSSPSGAVYTGRSNMRQVANPQDGNDGWMQQGESWRQRKSVCFVNGKWLPRKVIQTLARQIVPTVPQQTFIREEVYRRRPPFRPTRA